MDHTEKETTFFAENDMAKMLSENEKKLAAEKKRLETLSDNIPEGTLYRFVYDRDTKKSCMEYVSASWERITGLKPEDVAEDVTPFDNIVHPDDRKYMLDLSNETIDKLTDYYTEIRIRKNDEIRWLRVSSRPYIDGSKIIFDGIMTDITGRKEVEAELSKYRLELEFLVKERTEELEVANEELHASNEELYNYRTRLELMVEQKTSEVVAHQERLEKIRRQQAILINVLQIVQSSDDLLSAMDVSLAEIGQYAKVSHAYTFEKSADGTTFSCTHEWCSPDVEPLFGKLQNMPYSIVSSWFDLFDAGGIISASDINTLNREAAEILSQFGVKSTVVLPLSANGIHYGFVAFDDCVANRRWEQNDVELLKSISQLVSTTTHRYRAESAINLSQQTMRKVLNNITANITVTDFDTMKILFANENVKKLIGKDIEGVECWKVMHRDKYCECEFCPKDFLRDVNNYPTGVYHWEHYNELFKRFYACDSVAIEWIDGRLVQLEIAFDITELKASEMELIRAKEKAEESDKLKSAFLANMSHEIRTPVNGIVGFLHFLSSNNLPSQRKNDYINIINNSSRQLVQLIDDIIDVAKIEAKQFNILPIPANINDLMHELYLFFETYLQTQNKERIMLILDESGFINNCVTFVDPSRLRQVLNNLLVNAVKFTEKGYIRFGYHQLSPSKLEFVVEDTGIGLAANMHKVIFERFRQAELTNNRLYGGTGLGLNIAQSLVQMMGGDIRVESVKGAGASFYFTISYLPVIPEEEFLFGETELSREEEPFSDKFALIVEPAIIKYKYYEKILASSGFTIQRARNMRQWLDVVSRTDRIDIVLVDSSVFDYANDNQIKQIISIRTELPVIFVNGAKSEKYVKEFIADRKCLELIEPATNKKLIDAIKGLLI